MSPRAQTLAQARRRRHIAFSRKLWSHTSSPSASYAAIRRQNDKKKMGTLKAKATTGKSSMKPLVPMRKKLYERANPMAPKDELQQAIIDRSDPEEKISESHLKHFEGCLRKDKPEYLTNVPERSLSCTGSTEEAIFQESHYCICQLLHPITSSVS